MKTTYAYLDLMNLTYYKPTILDRMKYTMSLVVFWLSVENY